jgi:hypothetical protein
VLWVQQETRLSETENEGAGGWIQKVGGHETVVMVGIDSKSKFPVGDTVMRGSD